MIKAPRVFLSESEWRRALAAAPQCSHGVKAGHYVQPSTGRAVCSFCEHGAPPQLGLFAASAVPRRPQGGAAAG